MTTTPIAFIFIRYYIYSMFYQFMSTIKNWFDGALMSKYNTCILLNAVFTYTEKEEQNFRGYPLLKLTIFLTCFVYEIMRVATPGYPAFTLCVVIINPVV